jgi:hypothetical protein
MKKILSLLAVMAAVQFSYAQTNTFPASGNVGIGTTSPTDLLQINDASSMRFQVASNKGVWVNNEVNGGTPSSPGDLFLNYSSTHNTLFNSIGGNVGIGTINPQSILDIGKNQMTPALRIGNSGYTTSYNSVWGLQSGAESIMIFGNNNRNEIRAGNSNAGGFLDFYTNNTADYTSASDGILTMRLSSNGNVSIGTTDPQGHKLAVNGDIIATKITVKPYGNWPDYVFKPSYNLPSLSEVKTYIDQNQHLPDMPSAETVEKDGQDIGEMNKLLLKKVEELTLYVIEKDKQVTNQQNQIDQLKQSLEVLTKEIHKD